MVKKLSRWVLQAFEGQKLEARKKASALWGISAIMTIMGTTVFLMEFFMGHPLSAQAPGLGLITGLLLVVFFLRRGFLDGAQITFLTIFLGVITAIPFLDPYDNVFELYRYSFLTAVVVALSGMFLRRRRDILFFTSAVVAGQIFVYLTRMVGPGKLPVDQVMILTLVTCLVVTILIGVVAVLNLAIQKQLMDDLEEKEAAAVRQRDSFARFVPKEFLHLLNRENIQDVKLGEGVQKAGTILVADIRNFTGISETLKPQEVMSFLNHWLALAAPAILKHRGIIDKFMGDGLLVLFPHTVEDAVNAGLDLLKAMEEFNRVPTFSHLPPVRLGIGINFGELILGTIGNQDRMDGTVVSDTVNIAAHLESQTKVFGTPMLISQEALAETLDPNQYGFRFLDTVKMKSRKTPVQVFEILDVYPPGQRDLVVQTKDQFEEALAAFLQGNLDLARQRFQELLEINPQDKPAQYYLSRCDSHS